MASELHRNGDIVVTTNDMREVVLHGDEQVATRVVHVWDHFERLFEDKPVCPFCELPMLAEYEQLALDEQGQPKAHTACVEDWEAEAERDVRFLEGFDMPLPGE